MEKAATLASIFDSKILSDSFAPINTVLFSSQLVAKQLVYGENATKVRGTNASLCTDEFYKSVVGDV